MAEADLRRFLAKIEALQAFVTASEANPTLRQRLVDCSQHHEVVALARSQGFEIGRRWGERDSGPCGEGDDNLLCGPVPEPGQECSTTLVAGRDWRLIRIHSCQASSPPDFWYDQAEHEWVCLLEGCAQLRFADEPGPRSLDRGDSLYIAPHRKHRLERSDGPPGTVWLALFWSEAAAPLQPGLRA